MPSEYYREVFGGEMVGRLRVLQPRRSERNSGLDDAALERSSPGRCSRTEVYVPLLLKDEDGVAHGNDWARGFMRGMHMRHDDWAELVDDEEAWRMPDPKDGALPRARRRPQDAPPVRSAPEKREDNHRAHGGWARGSVSVFQRASGSRCKRPCD